MNVKKVNGTMETVYDENGVIISITFLPEDLTEMGLVIVEKSGKSYLNTGVPMTVLENPVVTIKNPNTDK